MKFVLVNDRAAWDATCANCSAPIGFGYLHDVWSLRFYCDHACYLAARARTVPIVSRAGAGIDGLPIGGTGGFQPDVLGMT
jgi:hypothetical protein